MNSALYRYFWDELTPAQRQSYAKRAGTSREYLRIWLIPPYSDPRKIPKKALLKALADATRGRVTYTQVLDHFYGFKRAA
jgi:hypothetical protein